MGNARWALLAVLLVAGCTAAPAAVPDLSSLEAETADTPVLPYDGEALVPQTVPRRTPSVVASERS